MAPITVCRFAQCRVRTVGSYSHGSVLKSPLVDNVNLLAVQIQCTAKVQQLTVDILLLKIL